MARWVRWARAADARRQEGAVPRWAATLSLRFWVWGSLAATIALALALPYAFLLKPVALPLAAAAVGWVTRRRWRDALALALPVWLGGWADDRVGQQFMICLVLPWFAWTLRPRFAMVLGGSLMALMLAAIELKSRFAGSILTWHDVAYFASRFFDNIGVLAGQPTVLAFGAAALAAVTVAAWAAWRWDAAGSRLPTWLTPRACALIAMALVGASAWDAADQASDMRERGVWVVAEPPRSTSRPLARFLATVNLRPEWMPPSHDTAVFAQAVQARKAQPVAGGPADLVVFLQESQFNPAAWAGCPPALCRRNEALFGPARDTLARGPMQVHVFGGGTWLSEFTVATGVPHTVFGKAGEFAPFNVAPGVRKSFVRSLRAAGYRTVAVYPVRGGMMNARLAYGHYGFDRFYDASDLGLSGSFQTPDETIHRAARRVLEQERAHGQPVYLFVVTIFNHGEHGLGMDRVPAELRDATRAHFGDANEADNVADYLWRTRELERAMGETARSLLSAPRPTVLAWFGDHQPPFGNAIGLRRRIVSGGHGIPANFQTWYQVSSNRGGQPAGAAERPLDVAFLPGLLAQAAGVPLDDWLAANVTARERCGGLFVRCADESARKAYLAYLWKDLRAFDLP